MCVLCQSWDIRPNVPRKIIESSRSRNLQYARHSKSNSIEQSNSIYGLGSIEFGNRTKSNSISQPVEQIEPNRTQSIRLSWIAFGNRTQSNTIHFISFQSNTIQFVDTRLWRSNPPITARYSQIKIFLRRKHSACKTSLRRILSKQNTDVCKACSLPIADIMLHHITIFWELLNLKMCTNLKLLALRIKF